MSITIDGDVLTKIEITIGKGQLDILYFFEKSGNEAFSRSEFLPDTKSDRLLKSIEVGIKRMIKGASNNEYIPPKQ